MHLLPIYLFGLCRLRTSIKTRQEVHGLRPRLLLFCSLWVLAESFHLPPASSSVHSSLQQEGRKTSRTGCQAAGSNPGSQWSHPRLSSYKWEIICSHSKDPVFNKGEHWKLITEYILLQLCLGLRIGKGSEEFSMFCWNLKGFYRGIIIFVRTCL